MVMATSIVSGEEMLDSEVTATPSSCDAAPTASTSSQNKKPTCVIVLGMAGSGKTTFVQVLQYRSLCGVGILSGTERDVGNVT